MKDTRTSWAIAGAILVAHAMTARGGPIFNQSDVFVAGQDKVKVYRIPAAIVSVKGTILAFCEARQGNDQSPTDLVLKRSFDNGATWQPMQVVVDGKGLQAIMNPCPVIDENDGSILLLCNLFPDDKSQTKPAAVRQFVLKSTDDGATWSKPIDISGQIGDPKKWSSLCSGPGVSIQTRSGRLVVPLYHYQGGGKLDYLSAVIYSDDHGKTWRHSKNNAGFGDECQVVELTDGTLLLNIRDTRNAGTHKRRKIATSKDGGMTWSKAGIDKALVTPCCQACLLRYTRRSEGFSKNRILFSNPASEKGRVNMTVRISYDECKTWPVAKTVFKGPSAYSCLAILRDGSIGVLYETGKKSCYERIRFARFNLEWLTDGKDSLARHSLDLVGLRTRALETLREGMAKGKEWVKVHAAEALIWTGNPQGVKEAFLAELKKKPGPKFRIGVWRVLAQVAGGNKAERKKYVDPIVAALVDPKGPDRIHASETLGKLGYAERLKEVIQLAGDAKAEKGSLQPLARWILANGGKPEDEKQLAALLDSKNATVRTLAAYALRWLERIGPETTAKLRSALAGEPPDSRARVYLSSAAYTHAITDRACVQAGLLQYALSGSTEQKCEMCQALASRGDVALLHTLEGLMADADLDVRVNASYAVLKILGRDLKPKKP